MIVRSVQMMQYLLLLGCFLPVSVAWSQTYVRVEGASITQNRNDQRIPGDTGTDFPFPTSTKDPSSDIAFMSVTFGRNATRCGCCTPL